MFILIEKVNKWLHGLLYLCSEKDGCGRDCTRIPSDECKSRSQVPGFQGMTHQMRECILYQCGQDNAALVIKNPMTISASGSLCPIYLCFSLCSFPGPDISSFPWSNNWQGELFPLFNLLACCCRPIHKLEARRRPLSLPHWFLLDSVPE